ncbi:hypothetical protein SAMN05443572_104359 [Myxococcus fulvus]|uniref:Ribosomal protein L7/L12 C-terminal domain-containing protein n=1 Tax=Myxococcus fulvus TaxID=33 RepID=A0A511SZK9_MYXFU|nr:hypothetical protein [Myxococcus fulvus]GEN07017.1 hypothetical protein MFU01_20540 [Myxococcus fulvus]SEU01432.1 hypothetical protein SAMN05443572_104359 [Myxococcus fulvus]
MMPGPDVVVACPHCGAPHLLRSLATGNTLGIAGWTDGWCEEPPMALRPPVFSRCVSCHELFRAAESRRLGDLTERTAPHEESVTRVTLAHAGQRRAEVMHLLSRELGKSPTEARRMLDKLPAPLGAWSEDVAGRLAKRLVELGARVSLESTTAQSTRSVLPSEWKEAPRLEHPTEAELQFVLRENLLRPPAWEWEARQHLWWMSNAPHHQGASWRSPWRRTRAVLSNMHVLAHLVTSDSDENRLLRVEAFRELEKRDEALALLDSAPFPAHLAYIADFLRGHLREFDFEVRRLPPPP